MKYILSLILFIIIINSQPIVEQKNYADSLFNSGKYFDAITEYKRLMFFDEEEKYVFESNLNIGVAYKNGGFFKKAERYLSLAAVNSGNIKNFYKAKEYLIRTLLLDKNRIQVKFQIDLLKNDDRFVEYKEKLKYWQGWNAMFSENWEYADSIFSQLGNLELAFISKTAENASKSETLAKVMSLIIPGSGQFYAGEYLSGLLSLGWNVFLGYNTLTAVAEERVFDALVVGNLLWFRMYRGNYQNAEQFARAHNIGVSNRAYEKLKDYKGLKP